MKQSVFHRQVQALGFVVLFTAVTAAVWVGAEDIGTLDAPTKAVVDTFVSNEPNDIKDPGNVFSGARFDIVGFMGHPCYVITGEEGQLCADSYGLKAPLRDLVDNGQLATYLSQRGLLAAGAVSTVSSSSASSSSSSLSSESATGSNVMTNSTGSSVLSSSEASVTATPDYAALYTQRGRQIWDACAKKFSSVDARACYQRNIQLIERVDKDITVDSIR